MADRYVLDTFALVALFQDEPGAARVQELLNEATETTPVYLTAVNLGEVLYTIERRQGQHAASDTLALIDTLPIDVRPVDRDLALRAARLKATVRLGYADCFVAALADTLDATVLTGDPDFSAVEDRIAIEWLPRRAT